MNSKTLEAALQIAPMYAADGVTETIGVPGMPIMVRASDYNDLWSKIVDLLPYAHYMDPPDGGDVPVLEQARRMAQDAARYRALLWLSDQPYEVWWQICKSVGGGDEDSSERTAKLADGAIAARQNKEQ